MKVQRKEWVAWGFGQDGLQGSELEKDFENCIVDCWRGGGGQDRQNIPDGGKSVGKDMEIQKSLVGMLFKGKDGERDI